MRLRLPLCAFVFTMFVCISACLYTYTHLSLCVDVSHTAWRGGEGRGAERKGEKESRVRWIALVCVHVRALACFSSTIARACTCVCVYSCMHLCLLMHAFAIAHERVCDCSCVEFELRARI